MFGRKLMSRRQIHLEEAMRAGFVGLGNMGQPIARNLLKAGHEIAAFNRTLSRAEDLIPAGARVAKTVAEACAPGVVLTMLPDDEAVESCAFGQGGILSALPDGGLHVSVSTISVVLSRRLAEEHAKRGQTFVASPVFGRPQAAEYRALVVVAAGAAGAIERARPLLESIGRKFVVLGTEPSLASTVKLAGNFLIASALEALAEAFALVRKCGVDRAQFFDVLASVFQSPVYEAYGRLMVEERFEPAGFKMWLGLKDARLVRALADAAAVPMPLAAAVYDHLLSAAARGMGEIDWSAVANLAAEEAGIRGPEG
jgi:3-hydroxyisobutyrate dehydrogenase-like beta-hydroxyacid dehydrogenase